MLSLTVNRLCSPLGWCAQRRENAQHSNEGRTLKDTMQTTKLLCKVATELRLCDAGRENLVWCLDLRQVQRVLEAASKGRRGAEHSVGPARMHQHTSSVYKLVSWLTATDESLCLHGALNVKSHLQRVLAAVSHAPHDYGAPTVNSQIDLGKPPRPFQRLNEAPLVTQQTCHCRYDLEWFLGDSRHGGSSKVGRSSSRNHSRCDGRTRSGPSQRL